MQFVILAPQEIIFAQFFIHTVDSTGTTYTACPVSVSCAIPFDMIFVTFSQQTKDLAHIYPQAPPMVPAQFQPHIGHEMSQKYIGPTIFCPVYCTKYIAPKYIGRETQNRPKQQTC